MIYKDLKVGDKFRRHGAEWGMVYTVISNDQKNIEFLTPNGKRRVIETKSPMYKNEVWRVKNVSS